MVKMVVGSLIALPIAYSILFYGFNRDPLSVAPMLQDVSPSLVPAAFQDTLEDKSNSGASVDASVPANTDDLGFSAEPGNDAVPGFNIEIDDDFGL